MEVFNIWWCCDWNWPGGRLDLRPINATPGLNISELLKGDAIIVHRTVQYCGILGINYSGINQVKILAIHVRPISMHARTYAVCSLAWSTTTARLKLTHWNFIIRYFSVKLNQTKVPCQNLEVLLCSGLSGVPETQPASMGLFHKILMLLLCKLLTTCLFGLVYKG